MLPKLVVKWNLSYPEAHSAGDHTLNKDGTFDYKGGSGKWWITGKDLIWDYKAGQV